jgi:3'-5' exoribonuclease
VAVQTANSVQRWRELIAGSYHQLVRILDELAAPSDPGRTVPGVPVRDLIDGQDLDQVLLVREVELRSRRDGGDFLKVTFADRTGALTAMVWDGVEQVRAVCVAGRPIRVVGRYDVHPKYGAQVAIRALRPAVEGTFELTDLCAGPARPAAQMEGDLRELLATVEDPHLRRLLDATFGPDTDAWRAFRVAPAAKHYHQAYVHGLLEHALSVAQAVSGLAATFGGIDRDVAVTGALLHDVGKLEEYTRDPLRIEVTDTGRLHGHIPLGYYRVRRLIEDQPGFPEKTAAALLHIILSHHGSLEHGSPVVPCTREATLVHFVDNLGGRLGSFDRLERELPDGAAWSAYDRALGAVAHFGARAEPPAAAPVPEPAAAASEPVAARPPASAQEALPLAEPQRAAA